MLARLSRWRRGEVSRRAELPLIAWILVALTPVLFALATWDPSGRTHIQSTIRFLALPVLAVEMFVIGLAWEKGFRPRHVLNSAPIWMRAAFFALFAIALGTAIFVAPAPTHAAIRTIMWIIHLFFGLAAAHLLLATPENLRLSLWRLIVLGLCVYTGILALLVASIPDPLGFDWKYLGLGVVHVRQLGFYSVIGAAAALGLAAIGRHPRAYWLSVGAASLMLGLAFWSGTRGAPIALIAALSLGAALSPVFRNLRFAAAVAISVPTGLLLSLIHAPPHFAYGLIRISSSADAPTADDLSSGRISMWTESLNAIARRPLFGNGDTPFGLLVESPEAFNHPHNILLQVMLQWGIMGALCFFAIGIALCWRAFCRIRCGNPELAPAFMVTASLLVMSLYEGSLYHPYPIMMVALGLAFLLTAGKDKAP